MLDIRLFRESPRVVKESLRKRKDSEKLKWVDLVIQKDKEYLQTLKELEDLRHQRNLRTAQMKELIKTGKNVKKIAQDAKKVNETIKKKQAQTDELKNQVEYFLRRMPNLLHDSVPAGVSDKDNKVVKTQGSPTHFTFEPKDHQTLMEDLDLVDVERAATISGARFYFLKNEAVLLDLALQRFALDFLQKKGFTPLLPPFMIRKKPYEGVTAFEDFEQVIYKIENEDLYMIATSEHPMASMYMNETLDEKTLPLKYAGVSSCFRKEAGSHGKDTKGIFRVHQFNKIEQFVFSTPEKSWKVHEELLKNTEEMYKQLKLPYQVVNVCTGDLGPIAAKKYDLEVWMPVQKTYREAASCSHCTDYQARALNIRYGIEGEKAKGPVHTLNNTAIATTRTIVAILENFQQKNGSILIPKVLQPYMNGMKKIEKK